MNTRWGAVLLTLLVLAGAALAADLDTPKVGAAACGREEENGSVVLHEAPDGRSETLMRYFQGAPLQVLDLADGWAHVRMGMTGESLKENQVPMLMDVWLREVLVMNGIIRLEVRLLWI